MGEAVASALPLPSPHLSLAPVSLLCPELGVVVAALAGSALGVLVEEAAMAAGASTTWGVPRGSPSALVAAAIETDLVLEVAMALEVEPGADLA